MLWVERSSAFVLFSAHYRFMWGRTFEYLSLHKAKYDYKNNKIAPLPVVKDRKIVLCECAWVNCVRGYDGINGFSCITAGSWCVTMAAASCRRTSKAVLISTLTTPSRPDHSIWFITRHHVASRNKPPQTCSNSFPIWLCIFSTRQSNLLHLFCFVCKFYIGQYFYFIGNGRISTQTPVETGAVCRCLRRLGLPLKTNKHQVCLYGEITERSLLCLLPSQSLSHCWLV